MPRKGHSEEQIAYPLRQAETGKPVRELCREMGISAQAFYTWKRKYAGLGLNELRELRQRDGVKWRQMASRQMRQMASNRQMGRSPVQNLYASTILGQAKRVP